MTGMHMTNALKRIAVFFVVVLLVMVSVPQGTFWTYPQTKVLNQKNLFIKNVAAAYDVVYYYCSGDTMCSDIGCGTDSCDMVKIRQTANATCINHLKVFSGKTWSTADFENTDNAESFCVADLQSQNNIVKNKRNTLQPERTWCYSPATKKCVQFTNSNYDSLCDPTKRGYAYSEKECREEYYLTPTTNCDQSCLYKALGWSPNGIPSQAQGAVGIGTCVNSRSSTPINGNVASVTYIDNTDCKARGELCKCIILNSGQTVNPQQFGYSPSSTIPGTTQTVHYEPTNIIKDAKRYTTNQYVCTGNNLTGTITTQVSKQ
ncbi:MAG: hypothetical protein HY832_01350, partial [Candidatus Aenigmarchaeota archaeon]|nr:hypothetical protein [Candidatus Aenigmarchaeota archaeon]